MNSVYCDQCRYHKTEAWGHAPRSYCLHEAFEVVEPVDVHTLAKCKLLGLKNAFTMMEWPYPGYQGRNQS